MQTVYFNDSKGNKREIGNGQFNSDSKEIIKKFLNKNNYDALYWRYWIKDEVMRVDVGSHSESFTIESDVGEMNWEEK